MSTLLEQYTEAKQKAQDLLTQFGKPIVAEALEAGRHPQVAGFFWTQYVPYFNDGEACTFSLHEINWITPKSPNPIETAYGEAVEYSTYDGKLSGWCDDEDWDEGIDLTDPTLMEALKAAEKNFWALDSEIYEQLFGEHAMIEARFTETGIDFTVSDYSEHD